MSTLDDTTIGLLQGSQHAGVDAADSATEFANRLLEGSAAVVNDAGAAAATSNALNRGPQRRAAALAAASGAAPLRALPPPLPPPPPPRGTTSAAARAAQKADADLTLRAVCGLPARTWVTAPLASAEALAKQCAIRQCATVWRGAVVMAAVLLAVWAVSAWYSDEQVSNGQPASFVLPPWVAGAPLLLAAAVNTKATSRAVANQRGLAIEYSRSGMPYHEFLVYRGSRDQADDSSGLSFGGSALLTGATVATSALKLGG